MTGTDADSEVIDIVAIVGGGIMGCGIAASMLGAGRTVRIVEPHHDEATVTERVRDALGPGTDEGARLSIRDLEDAVSDADLVIEAIPEVMSLKIELWRRLGALTSPTAFLASNTSAFSIESLAQEVPDPSQVLGMHWFNPAHLLPCVEVVRGAATDERAIRAVFTLLREAGKQPALVRDSPGFIANRLQFAMIREAFLCLEEGLATAEDIDRIVSGSFGRRLAVAGPLRLADFGGLDTYLSILQTLTAGLGERYAPPALLESLVTAGRTGLKAGAGISDYTGQDAAALTRERDELLAKFVGGWS